MAYQIKGGVIINDVRELIGVNTAGINTALYVGENITLDATAGSVTATTFLGDGSSLTGIVTDGGAGGTVSDFNVTGILTAANVEVGTALSFTGGASDEFVSGITTDLDISAGANELVTAEGAKSYVDDKLGGGSTLEILADTGVQGEIDLAADEVFNLEGTDNQIVSDINAGVGLNTVTFALSSTLQLPGTLAFGAGGQEVSVVGVETSLIDTTAGIATNTSIPTQQAVKEYVDAIEQQVVANANLSLEADGVGFGTVALATEALNLAGTDNQISVSGADETFTISLPDLVEINANESAPGGLVVTGVTTVQAIADINPPTSKYDFQVAGTGMDVRGNVRLGVGAVLDLATNNASGITFSTDSGTQTVQLVGVSTDLDETGTGAKDNVLPTELAVKTYVDAQLGASNQLRFSDGTTVGDIDLANDTFEILGGTNVNTVVTAAAGLGNTITVNLDDDINLVGGITAGDSLIVSSGGASITGVCTATDFNSTSDIRKKENIAEIEGAVEKVQQIRGVTFDWKDGSGSSGGVIAQEVEAILPTLVREGEEHKTVIYNGLIGLLVQAVKEQQAQIDELREKLG